MHLHWLKLSQYLAKRSLLPRKEGWRRGWRQCWGRCGCGSSGSSRGRRCGRGRFLLRGLPLQGHGRVLLPAGCVTADADGPVVGCGSVGDELNVNREASFRRNRVGTAAGGDDVVGTGGRADGYGQARRQGSGVLDGEMLGLGDHFVEVYAVTQRLGRDGKFTYGRLGLVWRRILIRLRQRLDAQTPSAGSIARK